MPIQLLKTKRRKAMFRRYPNRTRTISMSQGKWKVMGRSCFSDMKVFKPWSNLHCLQSAWNIGRLEIYNLVIVSVCEACGCSLGGLRIVYEVCAYSCNSTAFFAFILERYVKKFSNFCLCRVILTWLFLKSFWEPFFTFLLNMTMIGLLPKVSICFLIVILYQLTVKLHRHVTSAVGCSSSIGSGPLTKN